MGACVSRWQALEDAPTLMQSIEFKCELRDRVLAELLLMAVGGQPAGSFRQVDTYFKVPDGRLKLRQSEGEPDELMFYHRINRVQPTITHFTLYSGPKARERYGQRPLPVWLQVEKQRTVWLARGVTIALDEVAGLGWFCEILALVLPSRHLGICHTIIGEMRQVLGPALGEPVAVSYSDLAAQAAAACREAR